MREIVGLLMALALCGGGQWEGQGQVTATTYGAEDRFTGQRTGCSWHGETPEGFAEVVNYVDLGVASNDYPCGTVLRLQTVETCWGEPLSSRVVLAVVTDRMAPHVRAGRLDLQPATALALGLNVFDPLQNPGCIIVDVEVLRTWPMPTGGLQGAAPSLMASTCCYCDVP